MTIEFPTQGELIKFVFDATGLLPTKRNQREDFDETKKKSIQTALGRLASEEGKLNERFGELTKLLSGELFESIPNVKIIGCIGEVLNDLFDVYNAVIRDEGTYLNKTETIRWFSSRYLIPRLVISVNKHLLRCNIAAENFITPPDPHWFLPTIDGNMVTWPLENVMRWAYDLCECSQTHFHYPGKNADTADVHLQQNLDNAANWLAGKGLPSLIALLRNFDISFESLRTCVNPKYKREISELEKQSIRVALLIARISSHVCRSVQQQFGSEFLAELIEQYRRYSEWIADDTNAIKQHVAHYLSENDVPPAVLDGLWRDVSDSYWGWFADKAAHLNNPLHKIISESVDGSVPEEMAQRLAEQYGKFVVFAEIEAYARQIKIVPPQDFANQLFAGFDLKKRLKITSTEIDQYANALKSSGVECRLPWMVPWLRGVLLYRSENFEEAFPFFQLALDQAKYCAGRNQYKLVNQYVELSAKTDRWREFKKGIEWAQYLNVKIRWLRDDEPTDENLKFVFAMLKKCRYADL